MTKTALTGARVFDGTVFYENAAVLLSDGCFEAIVPAADVPGVNITDLGGGILCPGFVDVQVNGGGGVLFNDQPDRTALQTMAAAHASLGATRILPTLITDTREKVEAAIEAVDEACRQGMRGIAGLHLEGPHLDPVKRGAHDRDLIRPMDADDLALLCDAAGRLPSLLITVAPESVSPDQIAALSGAGARVSLGHSNCACAMAEQAFAAGASMATHLFNAMSQLNSREPGLVGAVLSNQQVTCGLIADLIHVHPATLTAALRAKGQGAFLVSDAMSPAGTDVESFDLMGRQVLRRNGQLTLTDGTLAGADLDLPTAVRNVVGLGFDLADALSMATSRPAKTIGREDLGCFAKGQKFEAVHLSDGLTLKKVWVGA
ncbi:N-acetylglucosamine 6-phosphate deacetylase [Thalassococcus halodurans]|uniref:N-acetylglucosamine 6-phosphate deacetylase n=1 Tax=Thalassococcus halodurans TaxID=373675 RepID=A0A1H5T7U5_9RHOB|nr:N-acetylglucosamine-6-phosphate deacetylase [Thalassococcus halodurans]SEF58885.1 N-acetylglucosamine 6-phosphate deacetylase [Thalassococcus halodurans]